MIQAILDKLHYFQNPSEPQLRTKLEKIVGVAIKLWSALRKDDCRVDFDYGSSMGDGQNWEFVDYVAKHGPEVPGSPTKISPAQLPPKSFVLFPRVRGFFGPDGASPRILHSGVALPYDSPAFGEGIQEIEDIKHARKEFERGLRRGHSNQSSPVMDKRQVLWPATQGGS